MNNNTTSVSRFIRDASEAKLGSLHRLSTETGIAWSTLNRKINHPDLLTLGDIARISKALGLNPSQLPLINEKTQKIAA